jgi:DNA-directed RNA polymerase subunit RPC12/RpoP
MEYFCDKCKKSYSSYHSFWIHNKTLHSNQQKKEKNGILCEFCNHKYLNKYSLNRHLLKCSIKLYNEQQNEQSDKQQNNNQTNSIIKNNEQTNSIQQSNNEDLKLKIQLIEIEEKKIKAEENKIKEENKNLELKIKFEKLLIAKCKMHPKTFKSLNNKLINNYINNSHNTINNNNNIINNYFKIYAIGNESIKETLTLNEKREIMNSHFNCLHRIVEIVHCSKYNQFKNIVITNLKDRHAYKYDEAKGYFMCVHKNDIINDLVSERLYDIEGIYEELSTTNKLDINTKKLVKDFLEKIKEEDKPYKDIDGISYSNYRSYNENKVKILIYNNSDKISKDLTIVFDSLQQIED